MTKRRSVGAAALALVLGWTAFVQAQPPAAAAGQAPRPAVMGAPAGPPSPEMLSDGRVSFRLVAPNATEVLLNGDWPGGMRQPMSKDAEGVWSITVGPLTPELWGYTFSVNGVRTLDPRNGNTKRDGVRIDNILLIPGPASDVYEVKDVPHGDVSMVWYDSPTLKMARRMYVYTPPDYRGGTRRYPVFYLLHGGGGDEDAWFTLGRTSQILDNLIAEGKARPMIVVMTNGNAWQKMAPGSGPVAGQLASMPRAPAPAAAAGARPPSPMATAFPESLVKDVIPFVEKNYRAMPGKDNRAIAGLSMGGGHTVAATTGFPGTFGYVGVWSAGTRQTDEAFVARMRAVKDAGVRLYYVGCGVEDKLAYEGSKNLAAVLDQVGQKYTLRETPGGHTWFNWRIYLADIVPMLFR